MKLFSGYDLSGVLRTTNENVIAEIESMDGDRLLTADMDELCRYFEEKFSFSVPILQEENITVSSRETSRDDTDYGRQVTKKSLLVSYHVPFDGEKHLFELKPSVFSFPPHGEIKGSEIVITIDAGEHEGEQINLEFQRTLKEIKEYLDRIKDDIDGYRTSMIKTVRPRIEKRREKIMRDRGIVSSLGFPIRKREGAPQTHVAPIVRKKNNTRTTAREKTSCSARVASRDVGL